MSTSSSLSKNKKQDCFACRMVSGTGLIGIGGYLGYYARKNQTKSGKIIISLMSTAFIFLGLARYSRSYPFDKHIQKAQKT